MKHICIAATLAFLSLSPVFTTEDGGIPEAPTTHCKFSSAEDDTLRGLVARHGAWDWTVIAQGLPGRTGRQCRERWVNYLAPTIIEDPWSQEEDYLLLAMHRQFGAKWSQIALAFRGRTDVHVKNRYHLLGRRMSKFIRQARSTSAACRH
jgi:hypothetical protein